MARKKSIKKAAQTFRSSADNITKFIEDVSTGQTDAHVTWIHDHAIIMLYREFESLMLDCLVGAINNDSSTVSSTTGIQFPKHMTDEVCEYLITGTGYFDFKGRDGLIKTLKKFVPDTHYLITNVKQTKYKETLERLSTLRNFAAHESAVSKKAAATAVGATKMRASGAWLKVENRISTIITKLKELADDIEAAAPY
jgi:cupin superfamily acireductone dioxygenase involved in methionine salvage